MGRATSDAGRCEASNRCAFDVSDLCLIGTMSAAIPAPRHRPVPWMGHTLCYSLDFYGADVTLVHVNPLSARRGPPGGGTGRGRRQKRSLAPKHFAWTLPLLSVNKRVLR